jgi:hypothetical protein
VSPHDILFLALGLRRLWIIQISRIFKS